MEILQLLRTLFNNTDGRNQIAQTAYKRYLNRKIRFTKTFKDGEFFFIDTLPVEPKIVQEKANGNSKSKLLPKSTGPFRIILTLDLLILID